MGASLQPRPDSKAHYLAKPRRADYTIDQDWASYGADDHERWDRLYARSRALLEDRACDTFLDALDHLELSRSGIPDMEELSRRLERRTAWRIVPVVELVPDEIFFAHLANRRFPAGAFIRSETELDYLEEPDVFHDIFGHVPLLVDPVFADFMQAYGRGGLRAQSLGMLRHLARLYWYTVEFGLVNSPAGLRIFGAGILSSAGESVFSLEDPSPHRIAFDLERVMRTDYIIDDYQKCYFVIESFEELRRQCMADFGPLYERLRGALAISPGEVIASDRILSLGTMARFAHRR